MAGSHSRVQVVRPADLGGREITLWREFQSGTEELDNPFLAPEYVLAVGRVHSGARVAVLTGEDGAPCAFAAYEHGSCGAGLPIAPSLSDQQAVIARPGVPWQPQELLVGCGLYSLKLENYPRRLLPAQARQVVSYPSPVIDLASGYDTYVESRLRATRNLVPTMQRKRRKLERECGELRFVFDLTSEDEGGSEALRAVMRWKSAQYALLAEWDRFADPKTVRLVDELFRTRAAGCSGTLSVLYAGERIAAAHFGLRSETVICSWFPTYNPEFAQYSPGTLLHFLIAESAACSGIRLFDLGRGLHPYKEAMKSRDVQLARGRLFQDSVPGIVHRAVAAPGHYARLTVKRLPAVESAVRGAARHISRVAGHHRRRA